jgi:uncharacterized protein YecE (DUF72 family)
MKKDLDRLSAFLDLVPSGWRAAFEFRHASWHDEDVYETLRAHDAALVIADQDPEAEPALVRTATWGYLRLRRDAYDAADLKRWAAWIRSQEWAEAFAFFKHEDGAVGPRLAQELVDLTAK